MESPVESLCSKKCNMPYSSVLGYFLATPHHTIHGRVSFLNTLIKLNYEGALA
jgi:hypothetical protein